jgi:hypothetical protein
MICRELFEEKNEYLCKLLTHWLNLTPLPNYPKQRAKTLALKY